MIKKLIALLMVAGFMLGVPAATETVNGITWTYTVSNGKASVGGGSSSSPAVSKTTPGAITIPSTLGCCPVTSIGDYAFYNCSSLTNIMMPEGITDIGGRAFYSSSSLTSITIPGSVTNIGNYAFESCYQLVEVHITDIAKWNNIQFRDSRSNPLYNGAGLYLNGELLTDLVIPNITNINMYAFYGCDSIASVTIPDGVTSIGSSVFNSCSSLTNITISGSVTNIGYSAFESCYSLKNVYIEDIVKWCTYGISFWSWGGGEIYGDGTVFYYGVNELNVNLYFIAIP